MCLQVGFVIFWRKDLGAKAAHKMLVELTPDGQKSLMVWSKILLQKLEMTQFFKFTDAECEFV